nr:fasciclin domain-containing protein [uncultured Pedobacter sp.]
MLRILKNVLLFSVCLCFVFTSCKKEFDTFYKRPDNLADPIYQQLVAKGNFTSLLKCIDKAGYKETLSGGGYWTFFAADDAAFTKYLASIGKTSADSINAELARKIVTYNLVYNAFSEANLIKYQSPGQSTSDHPDFATKRKTAYYDFVYTTTVNNKQLKVVNTNRNYNVYVDADNNNKYIPYYSSKALTGLGLGVNDYKQFYPNADYVDFNVVDAKVTERDIPAENGIIHIVDKVIVPLENIDKHIAANDQYSEFKKLLDLAATYTYNDNVTQRYRALSKSNDSVYVKGYSSGIAFAPNNENFLSAGTDAQINGYTMFVPTNTELLAYTKDILKYYKTFQAAPPSILYDFINAHMWLTQVWPNKFNANGNSVGETANFDASAIVEKTVLSNGFFYGMKSVQQPNVFRTLYGFAYLNPSYSLMKLALDGGLKSSIIVPKSKFTIFMMSDAQIRANGYDFYTDKGNWGYTPPGGSLSIGDVSKARITRILETSVLPTLHGELDDLSGKGIVEAYNGEYIVYNAGKVYASGNIETNTPVTIDSVKTSINGKAYYTKNLLTFTESPILTTLQTLQTNDPANFDYFTKLYQAYCNYYSTLPSPVALGGFYTFLVPNNEAIKQAVRDGVIAGTVATGAPNFTPTSSGDLDELIAFINFHVLDKNTVVSDGQKTGGYPTLLKNNNNDPLLVRAISTGKDNLSFADSYGNVVPINLNSSNHLAYRTVIHSLTSYLKYNVQ